MAFRSVPAPTASDADAYAYSKTLKIYPLSEAANPRADKVREPAWRSSAYAAVLRHPRSAGHQGHH